MEQDTVSYATCPSAKTVIPMVQRRPNAALLGVIFDNFTGLYFYNARYYEPMLGRLSKP